MELILYWGDCLVEMKNIAEDSIDLILCDLPYGTTDRSGVDKKGNNRILGWDTVIPLDELWQQYRRVLKPTGTVVLTADQPFTSQLVISNLGWFKYEWIWKKKKTTGFLHANARPMKETEDILIFSPLGASGCSKKANKNMTYNPQGLIEKNVKRRCIVFSVCIGENIINQGNNDALTFLLNALVKCQEKLKRSGTF